MNRKFKVATNDQVSTPKKHKADPEKHAYPSLPFDTEDSTATEHNLSLLKQELLKPKPHFDSVISLMERTFTSRRQWILGGSECFRYIIKEYSCLSKSVYVSEAIQVIITISLAYVLLFSC